MSYGGQQGGLQVPQLGKINKYLLIFVGGLFILNTILTQAVGINLISLTGMTAHKVFAGHIYEVITYPFVVTGFMELLFSCLLIWFVGSEFENLWPAKRYISFMVTSILSGAFFYLLGAMFFSTSPSSFMPVTGLGALGSALCLAYGVIFPDRYFSIMLVFPIKAKYFCIVLVLMNIFSGINGGRGLHSLVHLGSMLGAFGFMLLVTKQKIKIGKDGILKNLKPKKKRANHLSLVEDEDDDDDRPKFIH